MGPQTKAINRILILLHNHKLQCEDCHWQVAYDSDRYCLHPLRLPFQRTPFENSCQRAGNLSGLHGDHSVLRRLPKSAHPESFGRRSTVPKELSTAARCNGLFFEAIRYYSGAVAAITKPLDPTCRFSAWPMLRKNSGADAERPQTPRFHQTDFVILRRPAVLSRRRLGSSSQDTFVIALWQQGLKIL